MASQVEICNMAIGRVGSGVRISSINGEEEEAIACKIFWDQNLDAVLKMAPWKCAKKRAKLSRLSATPEFDWDYKYQLPSDYIRMISVKDDEDYEEEGNFLLADADEIYIKYVYRLTNTGAFHPLLTEVLACRLAHLICVKLSGSKSLRDSLFVEAGQMMLRGESENAFEVMDEQVIKQDSWIRARQS